METLKFSKQHNGNLQFNEQMDMNNLKTSNLYKYYKKHHFYKIEKYFKIDQFFVQNLQECVGYWFLAGWRFSFLFLFVFLVPELWTNCPNLSTEYLCSHINERYVISKRKKRKKSPELNRHVNNNNKKNKSSLECSLNVPRAAPRE